MSSPDPSLRREGVAETVMHRKKKQPEMKRGRLAADEEHLFRRAMADARPLRTDTVEPPRPRPQAAARFSRLDEGEVLRESLEAPPHAIEIANGSALHYRRPSVNLKTMRRLARGSMSVQGEVDLHGLNSADAKQALKEFIEHSLVRGHTCIRVVHGKGLGSGHGGPVLKRKVDQWLRRWESVLAFVSARQADGGTGAVYVLLRKLT
jgi:DNA-nicking Smr family endonuclease